MAAYAEGSTSCDHADVGSHDREEDAETAPLREPEYYQYDIDIAEVAEVWRRGSRDRLVAARPHRRGAGATTRPRRVRRARLRLRRGPLDAPGRHRRGRARASAHRRAVRPLRLAGRGRLRRQAAVGHAQAVRRPRREDRARADRRSTARRSVEGAAPHHADDQVDAHLRDLFADDPDRGDRLAAGAGDLLPRLLEAPGHRRDAAAAARARRAGRAARAHRRDVRAASTSTSPRTAPCCTSRCGCRAAPRWSSTASTSWPRCTRCSTGWRAFADRVRTGRVDAAPPASRIRTVVNIGIGGSDLGPAMAYDALRAVTGPRASTCRFVSNVDGDDLCEATRDLDPAETLFVVVVQDVHHARDDHQRHSGRALAASARLGDEAAVADHFVAVSTNADGVRGVRHRHRQHVRVLGLGRRPLLLRLGDRPVADDRHRPRRVPARCSPASTPSTSTSARAPFERNLPVLMGLLGVWYGDFFGAQTPGGAALQPLPGALPGLPAAARHGVERQVGRRSTATPVDYQTGPIVWGTPGTNGQHAYYQLIHQGTKLIPADFIGFVAARAPARRPPRPADGQLLRPDRGAGLRQDRRGGRGRGRARRAGARTGRSPATARPHDPGPRADAAGARASWSRSTSTRCSPRARSGTSTPSTSGASSSARCWPARIAAELAAPAEPPPSHDSSTNALIRRYREAHR